MRSLILSTIILINLFIPFESIAKQPAEAEPPSIPSLMEKEFDGRDMKRVKVLAKNKSYTRYLITYMSGDYKISGIMNVPKGKGPFPVLILNHGYIHLKYYTVGRGLKREQDYFAKRGYVVIHPDYRNHGLSDKDPKSAENLRLGYVEDVINAVIALKKSNYKFIDKDNVGMLGHSLGGGIALNILVSKPDLVKACALYAPVSADYIDNFNRWIKKGNPKVAEKIILTYGDPETNIKFWEELSAINYLAEIKSPILLQHGTADKSVPIEWSERLVIDLRDNDKKIAYYKYPGGKHEFIRYWPRFMQRNVEFFDSYLK